MRISGIAVHRIAIADPPLRSSYGLHQPYALLTHSAVETACLDLIGRATGQPVCDLIGGRIKFVEDSVVIPDKPGLGVDLDHDQLARGRERYAKCPYRKRDDTAEMRKHVDPNWERLLPRC
jgi:L-alanine-DL-glutamate epimerase-like enolase superfamily enzyme